MHLPLLKLISKDIILSEKEKELFEQYFEPVFFSKNCILEEAGKFLNTCILLYPDFCDCFTTIAKAMKLPQTSIVQLDLLHRICILLTKQSLTKIWRVLQIVSCLELPKRIWIY